MKDHNLVQDGLVNCFMVDFRDYIVNDLSETFPVPENEFISKLQDFVKNDSKGISHYNDNFIGLFGDELKYIVLELSAHGVPF